MSLKKDFNEELNQSFLQSHQFIDLGYIRAIFLVFAFLYGLFAFTDLEYFPNDYPFLFVIRFGIVIPILIVTAFLTYHKQFIKIHQTILAFAFFMGGIGIAYMLILNPGNIVYYGGFFMISFSGFLLIKLRFKNASITGWSILLFYAIGYMLTYGNFSETILYNLLFMSGGNIIGMAGAYQIEKRNRKQFLDDLNIKQVTEKLIVQYQEKSKQFEQLQNSIKDNKMLQQMNQEKDLLAKHLSESEEQYKLLTTQMDLGLALHEIIYDDQNRPIDYRYISVNSAFEKLLGLKREDIIGKTVLEIMPDTEQYWIDTFGRVAITGQSIQFENYSHVLNRHFRLSAYSPKKFQFAVIVDDITERKQMEIDQDQREHDLLTTQTIAKLGTWRLNVSTGDVIWTEELYKMYGFDPNLPPPPVTDHMKLFSEESWKRLSEALDKTIHQGTPYELELERIHSDGSLGWMWVRGLAETNDQGEVTYISGAAQDITERKKLEQALLESNDKFVALFEQSPVSIEYFDADGNHVHANQASINLFGVIDPKELSNLNIFTNPNLNARMIHQLSNQKRFTTEIEYDFDLVRAHRRFRTTKSGIRLLRVTFAPVMRNQALYGYIVHSEDITDERQKQKEIEYMSYHDYLTGLYNRRYFVHTYQQLITERRFPLGVMMIDINGLKIINDAYGHVEGDKAIKKVSDLLMKIFQSNATVARIGGDEFAILIPGKNAEQIQLYKESIIEQAKKYDVSNIEMSLAIGYDIVEDPYRDIDDLLSKAENHLYRHKVTVGSSIRNHAIKAILNTLTEKYEEERIHSKRVSSYCKMMGKRLGISKEDIDLLELAGMYHDIGKISIPDSILKKPEKLTNEEFEIIKTHTQVGYQILKAADEYSGLAEYALSHHERWDGKGYPRGLKETDIPLFSRIICVVDSFEAMTSDRPYRKGMSDEEAIEEVKRCSGTQFDPIIARTFIDMITKPEVHETHHSEKL
jgi:diguanylate cyclase